MSQILNRVRDVDLNDSEAVKETLTAFFQNLLKYKVNDCNQWLRALENVINRFPKYCGTHHPTIETYLTCFLSSNNICNVIEAAKCAHAVQQVRPAHEKAATAKSCWRDQMIALCDAAHKLIDELFPKNAGMCNQTFQREKNLVVLNSVLQQALTDMDSLGSDHDNTVNKTTVLTTRLRNVLVFIQAMLVEIYPVAKPIQPQLVLAVILQALSASGTDDSANVTTIKIEALRTLDALVACIGSNLIPFSALVFRFVMQTLKWSSENPSDESNVVRVAAYRSMAGWLHCLRALRPGAARAWPDDLAQHIFSDVTGERPHMSLTVNPPPKKNLSKKAQRALTNAMLKKSKLSAHTPGEKNKNIMTTNSKARLVVAALECAEVFLTVCGIFLNYTIHKQFQSFLVRDCFSIQHQTTDRAISLLRALEACRKNCSPRVTPPTQYCLHLYSSLINHPQREIAEFCSQALLNLKQHLHCSPSSLAFSIEDITQKEKEKEEGRKRTSERNRVVLEKLLGIDWMNSGDPNTITIPDEPETKRPRTDTEVSEVTENVSISSDSVHSVEMCSDSDDESIIEGIELLREPSDSIEEVIFEPVVVSSIYTPVPSGIHNEPTQVGVLTGDEPTVESRESTQYNTELGIHDELTQIINVDVDEVQAKDKSSSKDDAEVEKIMEIPDAEEAKTQQQISDTVDGKSPLSMEVAYDYPNTGNDKVTVLEKMDDENLPSTNDTDDIQITCGQVAKSSQDLNADKNKDAVIPKVNGIDKSVNETKDAAKDNEGEASKNKPNDNNVTVEDMLADFVDEVNEEIQA